MKPLDEKELVQSCLRGDRLAQKELYERFSPQLLGVCLRFSNSQDEGEDILIEGFAKIFSRLGDYRFESSLLAWMRSIVLNTAISAYRTAQRHRLKEQELEWEEAQEVPPPLPPSEHLQEKDLLALIQQMPETLRMVFNLSVVEGFSHREIAEKLGMTESTSRAYLVRARNWLQAHLKR